MPDQETILTACQECNALVSNDGVGHAAHCSKCTDDGSEEVAKAWLASRPPAVREAIAKYPPTHLYRMKSTGNKVFIFSVAENDDGSVTECTVEVTMRFNPSVLIGRRVFGVPLIDLEDLGEI